MAEGILFNFVGRILTNLGSSAVQQIALTWGVEKELQKLENIMITIRNVVLDAEEKQTSCLPVKEWLQRLKVVIYDACDLLDEVATEALRKQVEVGKSTIREVTYFFTSSNPIKFRYVMGRKIKDLRERLDEIVLEMRDFQFVVKTVERKIEIKRKEETSSFVYIPDVIGRESDRDALVQSLMFSHSTNEENVHIIPIIGMGGLGKTTLAQTIYNDNRIQNHFSKRWWVCISDDFDIERILIKLMKAAGESDCISAGIEQLQSRVRKMLSDSKFFLVLDDVWNDDLVEWKKLQDLLMSGGRGSRIVVTTRRKEVASIVRTMDKPYELGGLSDDSCLGILVKWAFKNGEDSKHQNLISIAREIVKKCGGVPLAARTLGAYLFGKVDERDWLSVRDNEMWAIVQKENDILPVLKLSYDQMPWYLKHCFAYCSLFDKDEIIEQRSLIYVWMAQGFIQYSGKENEELEDIGEGYIDELVRRSFLLPEDKNAYKMHDLVHDLAQYVAGDECLNMKGRNTKVITNRVRHLSLDSILHPKFPSSLIEAKKLQTIVLSGRPVPPNVLSVEAVISTFRSVRVLDFNSVYSRIYEPDIDVLPKTIGNSKHLRYLVCRCPNTLPKSLCKLVNLQYLDLSVSKLQELPKDFGKLINLRCLLLSSKLTSLPEKGIGGLTSLRVLSIRWCYQLRSLGEGIKHLTRLRELYIRECPRLDSLPAGFKNLISLEILNIWACHNLNFSEDDDFQGLTSLKEVQLFYLPKLAILPKWLQHSTALRRLTIDTCAQLSGRCEQGMGEDWPKIAHVPEIVIDGRKINST